jgi:predicted regulator of Ras-like GTPase activity (Roadblock/LC7/MglB family)
MELKARVRPADIGDATFAISLERVFSQLASGSVKISFGELRQTVPQLFTSAIDCDESPVALPLNEILGRLNPALLVRRTDQKHVAIPEEISSPFGNRGDGLIFAAGPKAPEATPTPRAVTPEPAADIAPDVFQSRKPASSPAPARVLQTPVAPKPTKPSAVEPPQFKPMDPVRPALHRQVTPIPAATVQPSVKVPVPAEPASRPAHVAPAAPAEETIEAAVSIPASAALRTLGKSIGMPVTPTTPAIKKPQIQPQAPIPSVKPLVEGPVLNVVLELLAESWPESLRLEIAQTNLGAAGVALPVQLVEDAMRKGKVAFPWSTIRSWIRPALLPTISAHDSLVVELPLKVLAPLFMARIKEGKAQRKVAIDEKIPNLFFGFPQPEAAPVRPPAPAASAPSPIAATVPASQPDASSTETNYYVWNETSDAARLDETDFKRKPVVETNFLSRRATPNEVVAEAFGLDGVVGALVALPDGLMVSSKVPADLNADTLAAFLPHIFGKVSQCTKELRMGDLNNLNFTVGNVPWKIFRVNAIFFAAFGKAGQGLPTAQLAALAAQLDRKKQ